MPLFGTAAQTSSFSETDAGNLAWNYDIGVSSGSSAVTTNVVNLIRVNIRQPLLVTNVLLAIGTAGTTLTSGQNFVGLYNSAGTQIGTSADQTVAWGSTGLKTAALASGPFAVSPGFVWVMLVSNTTGTTPSFFRTGALGAAAMNNGFPVSTARWATNGTATTSLPASITPASNTLAGTGYWAGLT